MSFFSGSSSSASSNATMAQARDLSAKNHIKAKLIAAIKELQTEQAQNPSETIENCPSSNALCHTLEAMFVHGSKHSSGLLGKLNASLLAGATSGTIERQQKRARANKGKQKLPQNNFWFFVMIYTHGNTLKVGSTSPVHTFG